MPANSPVFTFISSPPAHPNLQSLHACRLQAYQKRVDVGWPKAKWFGRLFGRSAAKSDVKSIEMTRIYLNI
jgi:hypothetical protein